MKIIGKTKDGFMLTASKSEVAHLIGHYSEYGDHIYKLESGDSIDINAMFNQLYSLSGNRSNIEKAQTALREAADNLAPVIPVIKAVEPEKAP